MSDLQLGMDVLYTYEDEAQAEALPPNNFTLYAAGATTSSTDPEASPEYSYAMVTNVASGSTEHASRSL